MALPQPLLLPLQLPLPLQPLLPLRLLPLLLRLLVIVVAPNAAPRPELAKSADLTASVVTVFGK